MDLEDYCLTLPADSTVPDRIPTIFESPLYNGFRYPIMWDFGLWVCVPISPWVQSHMIDTNRRAVLEGVGAGAVLLAGGTALVSANPGGQGRGDGTVADVRVVHAIPDAPPVDVAVDGATVLDDFPFGSISPYVDLQKGSYDVTVTGAGGDFDGDTFFDTELAVEANADYTVAATGTLETDDADPALVPFVDDNDPAPADAARVRAVHLSPDAPAVDVAVADGPALIEDLEFREASDYIEVPGGDYTLAIRAAGASPGEAVYTFDASLQNGTTYSAFALGFLGGDEDDGFRVVPTQDSVSPAKDRGR